MNDDRLKHSYGVAKKMIELGKEINLTEDQVQELFLLGYIHDIGYQFGNNEKHNIIGGKILKDNKYKYWKEVYYHGNPDIDYKSLHLKILNMADMQIDKCGNDVGYEKRLEDIKTRYGEDSIQYINAKRIIDSIM